MKIINFGSLNIDLVYKLDHLLSSGETLRADSFERFVGGKGLNQSVAAARAGVQVMHIGKAGEDGIELADVLKKEGVDTAFVEKSADKSGHAIIQVDKNGQNNIIIYGGANLDVDKELVDRAFQKINSEDIILIQNEISNISYIIKKAHEHGIRIALNPSPINDDLLNFPLEYVNWFILNETEGRALTGETENEKIMNSLLKRYTDCAVVLTLGEKGVIYKDAKVSLSHGIYKVEAVDTTGAGDTFTGFFLAGIVKGIGVEENLKLASAAASVAVSRKGASPSIPLLEEVINFLSAQ